MCIDWAATGESERETGGRRERKRETDRERDGDSKRQRIAKTVAGQIAVGYTSHILENVTVAGEENS